MFTFGVTVFSFVIEECDLFFRIPSCQSCVIIGMVMSVTLIRCSLGFCNFLDEFTIFEWCTPIFTCFKQNLNKVFVFIPCYIYSVIRAIIHSINHSTHSYTFVTTSHYSLSSHLLTSLASTHKHLDRLRHPLTGHELTAQY